MPHPSKEKKFSYTASDRTGKKIEGSVDAENKGMAVIKIQQMNFFPISVEKFTEKKSVSINFPIPFYFNQVKQKEVMAFTQQLSTLLNAGMPLDKCLSILIELTEKKRFKDIITDIQKNVHSGTTFADSLAKYPRAFSKFYTNMVKAGESGGILEPIVERLSHFLESSQHLKDSVVSAMIYPILLTFIGGGAIITLLTYVVPKFAQIFVDMGQVMPASTQMLLDISSFLVTYYPVILLVLFVVFSLWKIMLRSHVMKEKIDALKLSIPVVGDMLRKIEVSRFSRTFGTLLESGVSILKALEIVKDTLTNTAIKKSIGLLNNRIKRGGGIAEPLKASKVFPSMATHMVAVGEESGALEEMLLKVADTYDKEVKIAVKRVIALIEPVMIFVMGIIVGLVVISMLSAVFSINDIPL